MPPVRSPRLRTTTVVATLALGSLVAAGCGEKDEPAVERLDGGGARRLRLPGHRRRHARGPDRRLQRRATTSSSLRPAAHSRSGATASASPSSPSTASRSTDADVAIYAAHGPTGKAEGPFPAQLESLETEPAFTAQTTSGRSRRGEGRLRQRTPISTSPASGAWWPWSSAAAPRRRSGSRASWSRPRHRTRSPEVGEKAPVIHTPTVDDVGDVTEIDTRVPPATCTTSTSPTPSARSRSCSCSRRPALCTSRVCGPVVDVAEQVKRDRPDDAAYIHMEIWNDNDPNKGAARAGRSTTTCEPSRGCS